MTSPHRQITMALLLAAACGNGGAGADAGRDAAELPPASEDWTRDILHTALDVDFSTRESTAVITLAPATSTGASFEVGDLNITRIHSADGALNYERDGAELDVGVPAGDEPVEITFEYTFDYHDSWEGASSNGYTLTWPYHCGNLFPCKSDPADGLTFDLELSGVPAGQTAVYPASIPTNAPSYMLAWAVGDYTRIDLGTTTAGTGLVVWHLPGSEGDAVDGTEHLVEVVDWLEQSFGRYSFGAETGVVEVQWGAGALGGMEHHPFWHVGSGGLDLEEINAHEAVHGWFGNGVRIACWEDFVLSEGPAEYLAARALIEVIGGLTASRIWSAYRTRLNGLQASPDENKIAWPDGCNQLDIIEDGLFNDAPYIKGAFFFRALENRIGAPALDAALAAFLDQYLGKAAGMQDLLDTIGAETGYDPNACALAWLRSEELPAEETCPEP